MGQPMEECGNVQTTNCIRMRFTVEHAFFSASLQNMHFSPSHELFVRGCLFECTNTKKRMLPWDGGILTTHHVVLCFTLYSLCMLIRGIRPSPGPRKLLSKIVINSAR